MNSDFYDNQEVSSAIEQYCKEKQIKEADFASLVKLDPVQLSRIKGGKSSSYESLCKIAVLVERDVKEFLKPVPQPLVNSVKQNLAIAVN